jgi:hypothetical protein
VGDEVISPAQELGYPSISDVNSSSSLSCCLERNNSFTSLSQLFTGRDSGAENPQTYSRTAKTKSSILELFSKESPRFESRKRLKNGLISARFQVWGLPSAKPKSTLQHHSPRSTEYDLRVRPFGIRRHCPAVPFGGTLSTTWPSW